MGPTPMVGEPLVRSSGDGLELGQAKPICVANANQKTFGFKRDEGCTPWVKGLLSPKDLLQGVLVGAERLSLL